MRTQVQTVVYLHYVIITYTHTHTRERERERFYKRITGRPTDITRDRQTMAGRRNCFILIASHTRLTSAAAARPVHADHLILPVVVRLAAPASRLN